MQDEVSKQMKKKEIKSKKNHGMLRREKEYKSSTVNYEIIVKFKNQ